MKILLIHQYFLGKKDAGGSRFNEFVRLWEEQGAQITVLAGMVNYASGRKNAEYKGKFIVKEQYSANTTVYRCHVSEAYNLNFIGRLWAYFSFVFSSIIATCKIKKHDIILVTSPPLFVGITGLFASILWKKPFIFEVRDLWPESAIDTGVLKNQFIINLSLKFESYIYRKSHRINVLTPAFKEKIISKGIESNKILYIPNAADFSISESIIENTDRSLLRKEYGFEGKIVILYVGAHGVANHLIQIVDTAERFRKDQVLFVSIGAGMQKKMLVEEMEKRNLENVRFLDPVPKFEVFKYIFAADIGASILKKVDTFKTVYSNKTFDYMACKKPILMLIDGVSRKLIEDANAGLYCEPENIAEIEAGIRQYITNPKLILEHGNNGYNFAKKYFDRSVLAKEYFQLMYDISKSY